METADAEEEEGEEEVQNSVVNNNLRTLMLSLPATYWYTLLTDVLCSDPFGVA